MVNPRSAPTTAAAAAGRLARSDCGGGRLGLPELEQQAAERGAALGVERLQYLVLHLLEDRAQLLQAAPAGGGEAHHVAAAILGIAVPLDQALVLEVVEHSHELTA